MQLMRVRRFALGVTLLCLLAATGCRDDRKPLNVIVITLDTLRADHLGTYGFSLPTSPNLDAFARGAAVFERNWAQAPCTYPSVNSLMTSRYPSHFSAGLAEGDIGIPPDTATLAEMLKARGYTTHAVSASPIVRATPSANNPRGGFGRGFETFDELCLWNNVQCVNQQATWILERVANRRSWWAAEDTIRPFFLYLHYMDPHDPYVTPEYFKRRFSGEYTGSHDWVRQGDPNLLSEMIYGDGSTVTFDDSDIDYLRARYNDGIAYVDDGLSQFLGVLETRGLLEDTLVVVLSDHGESFMEHGHIKHCYHLYEHNLQTPLIIRAPGGEAGRRIRQGTSNLDVVPTILDYVDRRLPSEILETFAASEQFQGRSLRDLVDGREPTKPPEPGANLAFASTGRYRAVTDGRWKLIFDLGTRETELYDLETDPGETTDLDDDRRKDLHRLRTALLDWVDREEGQEEALANADEAEKQLRALGYLR